MAVVDQYGTIYVDDATGQNPGTPADSRFAQGKVCYSVEKFNMAGTDSSTSKYHVASIPREAVLLPGGACNLVHSTNMPTDIDFGDASFTTGLLNAYNGSAGAATKTFGPATADVGKPLWELLGHSAAEDADPLIDLFITINASPGGAVTGHVEILYSTYG